MTENTAGPPRPNVVPWAALAVCALFLGATTLSLVTLDRVKYAALAQRGTPLPRLLHATLQPVDAVLVGCTAIAFLAAVALEWRGQGLRRLFAAERPGWLLAAAAAIALWFCHTTLTPGLIVTGDAGSHVARVNHLAMAIRDGASLFWDNYFFGGGMLLQFTGPVFHWFATVFTLLAGDPTDGVKIAVLGARLTSGWMMFLLLRRIGLGLPAATLGALFYLGSFFATYLVAVRSTFPQAVNLAAMPAILYFAERVLTAPAGPAATSRDGVAVIGLALAAIAMIGDHQPTALIFAFYAALFVAARGAMLRLPPRRLLAFILPTVLIGIGSLYFLLPFAAERSATAEDFSAGGLVFLQPPPLHQLGSLLVWGRMGLGSDFATYQGLVLLGCAVAGGVALLGPTMRRLPLARLWLLLAALAVLSLFVWGTYVRQNVFTFCFICAAAAVGAQALLTRWPNRSWLVLLLFAAFLLDAGPSAVQPWNRIDMQSQQRMGAALADRAATQRVLETSVAPNGSVYVSVGPDSSPIHYARVQELRGPHKLDATKAHNFLVTVMQLAQRDMNARGALSDETWGMLAALNVGWVVGAEGPRVGLPAGMHATLSDPVLGRYWRIPGATPFLTSGTLEPTPRPASFGGSPYWNVDFETSDPRALAAEAAARAMFDRMGVDLATRQAAALLLPHVPDGAAWTFRGPAPLARLESYSVAPGTVHLIVQADRQGFIRLAHPLSAFTRVTQDGAPVVAAADIGSLIVLPLHEGRNDIVVVGVPSLLRQVCFWISATLVGLLLLGIPVLAWRRRTESANG